MTPHFRKQEKAKTKGTDSADPQRKEPWRLYFGRTPGGIPAVRVAKKDYRAPDSHGTSEGDKGDENK